MKESHMRTKLAYTGDLELAKKIQSSALPLAGAGAAGMRKIFKKPPLVGIDFPPLRENGNRSTEEDKAHGKRHFPAGRGGRRAGASFF